MTTRDMPALVMLSRMKPVKIRVANFVLMLRRGSTAVTGLTVTATPHLPRR